MAKLRHMPWPRRSEQSRERNAVRQDRRVSTAMATLPNRQGLHADDPGHLIVQAFPGATAFGDPNAVILAWLTVLAGNVALPQLQDGRVGGFCL